jgi:hypothetical protein
MQSPSERDLLDLVRSYYERNYPELNRRAKWPDRDGEYHIYCPDPVRHGHVDQHTGSCSFSERTGEWYCFACQAGGTIYGLARLLGLIGENVPPPAFTPRDWPERRIAPDTLPQWRLEPDYLRQYRPMSRAAYEYARSRGLTDATLERWQFGSGALPRYHSRCGRERLILPVFHQGKLVGLRGRLIPDGEQVRECMEGCDHAKWLQASGGDRALFGADLLRPYASILICEAPLSAVLANQEWPWSVAIAGVDGASTWHDHWTDLIVASKPSRVMIAYDNDDAGRKGRMRPLEALTARGVKCALFEWGRAPESADIADLATGRVEV